MKALILAAGYAVRLKELTRDTPKSLLEIGGRKIIDRIVEKITRTKEIGSIYLVTNSKFFEKFKSWVKDSGYSNSISIINDGTTSNEMRLGAIKDLEIAITEGQIDEDLLVVAGDNLFEFELTQFLKFAMSKNDGVAIAVHDIRDRIAAKRFGVVELDKDKRVVDFEEKPTSPKSTLISTGIYYFPKGKLSSIKEYLTTSGKSDAPGYYIAWLVKKDRVYGFAFKEGWYDIGDIESFKKADSEYRERGE